MYSNIQKLRQKSKKFWRITQLFYYMFLRLFFGCFVLIWKISPWKTYIGILSVIIWKLYSKSFIHVIIVFKIRNMSWIHLLVTHVLLVFRLGNTWELTLGLWSFLSKFSAYPICILFLLPFLLLFCLLYFCWLL